MGGPTDLQGPRTAFRKIPSHSSGPRNRTDSGTKHVLGCLQVVFLDDRVGQGRDSLPPVWAPLCRWALRGAARVSVCERGMHVGAGVGFGERDPRLRGCL